MTNTQKPEPAVRHGHGEIDVHSMFYTIQGECIHQGRPALFLRLAGCSLQCPLCDTEYTQGRYRVGSSELAYSVAERLNQHRTDLLVITGGEPLRQQLDEFLTHMYQSRPGTIVQIETNGIHPITPFMMERMQRRTLDVVVSPKVHYVDETLRFASAWKYIIQHGNVDEADGLPIQALENKVKGRVARPLGFAQVWLNPADEQDERKNKRNRDLAAKLCLKFGYRLGVQLHKIYDLE